MNAARQLREMLAKRQFIAAPGVYDGLSLLLANKHGFAAHYASGYWSMGSRLGVPDVGIAGYRDFVNCFSRFAKLSNAPLIADADTGFGGIPNLIHAVKGYQEAGIAAIQIEDQPFPKVCGQTGLSVAVEAEEMVQRIRAACEARAGGDIVIIARSDARHSEGSDATIARLALYAEAGADVLFFEAAQCAEEIRQAAEFLVKPLMINAPHGAASPVLEPAEYEELGAAIAIYPGGAPLCAAQAADSFYEQLKGGTAETVPGQLYDFREVSKMLGIGEAMAAGERFAARDPGQKS